MKLEQWMRSRGFLTHSSCMCPEVSVRSLSRCPQKAPHLDTPSGTPAVLPCAGEPVTHTAASVLLPGDVQTRPCGPAEAVSSEKAGDTGTHMEKVISMASTSAQRPHTLSQGSCRTHFEVQEACFYMMLCVLPCLGRETCFVLPFLVCE